MACRKLLLLPWLIALATGCHSPGTDCAPALAATANAAAQHTGFNFFVLGDWGRRGTRCQQAVAHQMRIYAQQRHPAFIITTGDNFYEEGVRSVYDSHWAESFTNVYKELTQRYDWYPVLGNHDYQDHANPQAEIDYYRVNPRWKMPFYYSTMVVQTPDHQLLRFLFIDTSPFYKYYYVNGHNRLVALQDTARQRQWIDSTLANAREPWKFVVGHHPVYSSGYEHGNTAELIQLLAPLLEKNKVQAYISGHDHNLQHQRPAGSYVDYFVCGGGADAEPAARREETKFAAGVPGFADISIQGDSLVLQYIDKEGKIIYTYSRKK